MTTTSSPAGGPAVLPIDIQGVRKRFGSLQALDGITLGIEPGDFFALLGPNGAGKTTLISIIAGLAKADSGQVRVMGHDVVKDYQAARKALGVVPQELVFDPFFTVRETLNITAGYYGVRNAGAWIDRVLEGLGLSPKANTNMRALSGGMKRRVLVAQALVHRPPVIVLDEPTAGVDVELRQSLWTFVQQLNREGHTIVLTTHYLEEAQALCNRVAVMKAGRVVALDSTEALLKRFSAGAVMLSLSGGSLPEFLKPRQMQPLPGDPRIRLSLDDYAELAPIIAAIQATGATIQDMEIARTDLEDVFVRLMQEG
ncbi:MAG: ABC transporter ATP-binding protein [Lautropia sp.]|nr:ABC transporter ATP-binding protein [Lautropia sp.]